MRWASIALVALLGAAAAGAEPAATLQLSGDDLLRAGTPLRCSVRRDIAPEDWDTGPATLALRIIQGGEQLAALEVPLVRLGQVHLGIDAVLVPSASRGISDQPVLLSARLAWAGGGDQAQRELATPRGLARELEAQAQRLARSGDRAALPRLWLEQAGEIISGPTSLRDLQDLAGNQRHLAAWLAGERQPAGDEPLRALRDPVDDWVQPYRVYPAAPPARAVALLLVEPARAPSKARWRALPDAWLSAARSAGVTVVEAYPAGDPGWSGAALPRALQALDEAAGDAPATLVGVGRGAAGALRLAEDHPGRFHALALADAVLPATPATAAARWRALRRAGGLRPALLGGTPLLLLGGGAAPERFLPARAERLSTTLADSDCWHRLAQAAAATPAPPDEAIVTAPTRCGEATVLALSEWGVPGTLRWIRDRCALEASGIAALRLDRRLALSGVPVDAPAPAPGSKSFGRACGPLDGYRDGPFVVVVGTGESAAALASDRALAHAFASAWVAHAQSAPRMVDDSAFDPRAWPTQHLVLIGNPRANAVAARLIADGWAPPARWDARTAVIDGRDFARGDGRAIALCGAHPAHDGRLVVLLDGALPPVPPNQPPLAGLGDLYVGAAPGESAPAIDRLLDNDWR